MLSSKGDEICDRGGITSFDVGSEELAALGEAYGVEGGEMGEDWVSGDVGADFVDLLREIAEEGGGAVGGGVIVEADEVGVGGRVCLIEKGGDGAKAVGFVAG